MMECDTFEAFIFLKVNIMHWNLHDVVFSDINREAVPDEDYEVIVGEECEEDQSDEE